MAMAQCPNCATRIALPKGRLAFHCYSCMAPVNVLSVAAAAGLAAWFWLETFSLTLDR